MAARRHEGNLSDEFQHGRDNQRKDSAMRNSRLLYVIQLQQQVMWRIIGRGSRLVPEGAILSMFSRWARIGAVLLALAQLGVWGFAAPAHRLQYHSQWRSNLAGQQAARGCRSHCCAHHHHPHPVAPAGSAPHEPQDQCPDDDSHCSLCIVALHCGDLPPTPALISADAPSEGLAQTAWARTCEQVRRPFDSRGPPGRRKAV